MWHNSVLDDKSGSFWCDNTHHSWWKHQSTISDNVIPFGVYYTTQAHTSKLSFSSL